MCPCHGYTGCIAVHCAFCQRMFLAVLYNESGSKCLVKFFPVVVGDYISADF